MKMLAPDVDAIDPDLTIDLHESEIEDAVLAQIEERLKGSPVDAREPLNSEISSLDDDQKRVVADRSEVLRVIAPAGAGKTQTQVNRVISLLRQRVRAKSVLMLTFDRAAASALQSKFRELLTAAPQSMPEVFTLNAYGASLLRNDFPSERATLVEPRVARQCLKKLKEGLKAKRPDAANLMPSRIRDRYYLDLFSYLKNQIIDPRTASTQEVAEALGVARAADVFFEEVASPDDRRKVLAVLAWMYRALEQAYRRLGVMDFDDQKLRALRCCREHPDDLKAIQARYTEVIVDEFQDINKLDFELIMAVSQRSRLIVTGDDDQAIYGFRGCSPDYIIRLPELLERPVTTIELRTNYRCPRNIVVHATDLIRHNTWRLEKNPIPHRTDNASIKVLSAVTASLESRLATNFIKRVKRENLALGYQDFAVLYRTNAQSLPIQIQFILEGIPFFVRKEDNILESQVLDRLLGVLRVRQALQEGGEPQLDDAILVYKAFFPWASNTALEQIHGLLDRCQSIRAVLLGADVESSLFTYSFHQAVKTLTKRMNLLDTLMEIGQTFKGLQGMVGSMEDFAQNDVPLGEILSLASSYQGRPKDFIAKIESALTKAREVGAGADQEHGVSLATYFRSKGLQWHTVLLTGCNQRLIPMGRAPIEEERRLFYVAMTRASSNLYISYTKKSCGHLVDPSQFLGEAGLLSANNTESEAASPQEELVS